MKCGILLFVTMIVGSGDVAKAIKDREGFVFFCCGISNRTPFTYESAKTEIARLLKTFEKINGNKSSNMFVYFSSLSIFYAKNKYVEHKTLMEKIIKLLFPNYCIVRIGNITWGDNPNTIINYFKRTENPVLQDGYRYLVSEEEMNHWLQMIPAYGKYEFNITGERVQISELFKRCKK